MNKSPLSKQSRAVLTLLSQGSPMSVCDIASEIGVFPSAIYRNLESLIAFGLINSLEEYPTKYACNSHEEALENYLSIQKALFQEFFGEMTNTNKQSKQVNVSFITTRSQLLSMLESDIDKAKEKIDHVVSGIELPSETILKYKKAIDRGVNLRFIVQNLDEINSKMLRSWQKMGFEVRHHPLLEARIIILDSKIAYFTSYSKKRETEAIGIRFAYSPIARQMIDVFEQRWRQSAFVIN